MSTFLRELYEKCEKEKVSSIPKCEAYGQRDCGYTTTKGCAQNCIIRVKLEQSIKNKE